MNICLSGMGKWQKYCRIRNSPEMKILNVWQSTAYALRWYEIPDDRLIYENVEWRILDMGDSFLYSYQNIATNHLVGLNIELIDYLAEETIPSEIPMALHYERALETIQTGQLLLLNSKQL